MPFDTDTAWPAPLHTIFQVSRAPLGTLEHRYYGPYDKLLNYCFDGFTYFVAPQAPPRDDTTEKVDFVVFLVMDLRRRPVFLIGVKDDSHPNAPSKRAAADRQMRARYDDLLYQCPLPKLYGVSVIGTKMRVYAGDAAAMTLDPPRVPTSPDRVLGRTYLEDAWSVDILSAEGFVQMKQIVDFIKTTPLNIAAGTDYMVEYMPILPVSCTLLCLCPQPFFSTITLLCPRFFAPVTQRNARDLRPGSRQGRYSGFSSSLPLVLLR